MRQLNCKIANSLGIALAISLLFSQLSLAQQVATGSQKTTEPVFRVSKLVKTNATTEPIANENDDINKAKAAKSAASALARAAVEDAHPLDRALRIAHNGLKGMQSMNDYTALLVKRERVNGKLTEPNYMQIKVRNARQKENAEVPLSIYMKFLKPKDASGREVIWVKGQNNDKLAAHEGGLIGFKTFWLDPNGWIAMQGNRYPIYDAGLENLVLKLIEKAERDRAAGPCEVTYREGCKINKRSCTLIKVTHKQRKSPYEFHEAQVFIDDELQIPVRYAAYDWPTSAGGKPRLLEEYTYLKVQPNVGLSEIDFDVNNPKYKFNRK